MSVRLFNLPSLFRASLLGVLLLTLLTLSSNTTHAAAPSNAPPLPASEAFVLSITPVPEDNPRSLTLSWDIAPGYYLYQKSLMISTNHAADILLNSVANLLPPGVNRPDIETNEPVMVYTNHLEVSLPIEPNLSVLEVRYQGCSERGICYPPTTETWHPPTQTAEAATSSVVGSLSLDAYAFLKQIVIFFGLGLLLSFTPCVLPMIPILSEIILGHGRQSFRRSCILAGTYLVTMAFCYAMMGYATATLGIHFNNILQDPRFLIVLIVVIVLLACMQLDWIHFRWSIPHSFKAFFKMLFSHKRFRPTHHVKSKPSPGTIWGAISLGALSALMLSPCVTPALVGSLIYITQSEHPLWGSMTLFALGLGTGTPLALAICFGSRFLPKTGAWMVRIKHVTGVLLLVLAAVLITRLGLFKSHHAVQEIHNPTEWHQVLETTPKTDIVLLDVYADWCFNCQIMERTLFSDANVMASMKAKNITIRRLDVTHATPEIEALMHSLNIMGPPTFLFFHAGKELTGQRSVGYLSPASFSEHIEKIDNKLIKAP